MATATGSRPRPDAAWLTVLAHDPGYAGVPSSLLLHGRSPGDGLVLRVAAGTPRKAGPRLAHADTARDCKRRLRNAVDPCLAWPARGRIADDDFPASHRRDN